MTTMQSPACIEAESADRPPRFYCAEVWGGNRLVDTVVELPGLRGVLYSQPSEGGRGGDIHYTSICGSGLLSRLCLADVVGHGEPVAVVSGEIHNLLRRYMNSLDERRVLRGLNERLAEGDFPAMTTAAVFSYFPPLRLLSVTYAGHPPGWLYRRDTGRWERLLPTSFNDGRRRLVDMPLAIDRRTDFTRRKVCVRPGDRFLLVTDGVLEAPSATGELFGEERLVRLLAEGAGASTDDLARRLLDSLVAHTGDTQLSHDDVTFILCEFTPGPRAFGVWHMLRRRLFPRPS